jgi:serine/threonine protein kinase/Tfp pilus assembly protein PilF
LILLIEQMLTRQQPRPTIPTLKGHSSMIGETISHYRIIQKIGAGGMGEVYRAHDDQLNRDVAIKVLNAKFSDSAHAKINLLREAQSASALNDPHICTIYEIGEVNGHAFIVMEFIEGRPLKELIPSGGLPAALVIRYGTQISAALAHAHDHNIIHRDVKTSNVVITPTGQAKVLDFGLAKQALDGHTSEATLSAVEPGGLAGTPAYMAPEILRGGPADARSDVWALGVVIYEMATGRLPFRGHTVYELSAATLREPAAPLPPSLPLALRVVIQRCLEKEPGHRYQRAGEVRAILEAAQFDPDTSLATSSDTHPALETKPIAASRRTRMVWVVGLLTAVLAAGLVALSVSGIRRSHALKSGPHLQSLAVLPLDNLSGDPSQQYFADGMTDELITDLAQISGLHVISRTSAMQYKDSKKSLPQIARELNVDGVIEGTVERVGDRVRIRAQLIDAATDRHVWAKSYERALSDILAMQDEVARGIASEIQVVLTPAERARLTSARAVNPQAHDALIRGLYLDNQGEAQKGLDSVKQAVAMDPGYADARAALAQLYIELGNNSVVTPGEAYPKAKSEALRAIELDENLGEAHEALAELHHYYDWDFAAADREYRRALELKPGDAQILTKYAFFLCHMGKHDDAIRESKRAQDLDPLSLLVRTNFGIMLHYARRYDDAIAQYRKVLELEPKETTQVRYQLARVYMTKRMFPEALTEIAKMRATDPSDVALLSLLSIAYGFEGKRKEATTIIYELKDKQRREYVRPYILAEDYAALGEKNEAMDWLEKAYEERDDWINWIKVDPNLDVLRSEPRFADLLRRVGFPL